MKVLPVDDSIKVGGQTHAAVDVLLAGRQAEGHGAESAVPSGVGVQNIPGPRGARGKAQEHHMQLAAGPAS